MNERYLYSHEQEGLPKGVNPQARSRGVVYEVGDVALLGPDTQVANYATMAERVRSFEKTKNGQTGLKEATFAVTRLLNERLAETLTSQATEQMIVELPVVRPAVVAHLEIIDAEAYNVTPAMQENMSTDTHGRTHYFQVVDGLNFNENASNPTKSSWEKTYKKISNYLRAHRKGSIKLKGFHYAYPSSQNEA